MSSPRHVGSVVVGMALGVAWLGMRPMLTGFGLAVVAFVAAAAIAWTWRRTRPERPISARERNEIERPHPPEAPIPGRVERMASDAASEFDGGTPMITCVEQLISEYIDGELPPAVARELEDHLRVCAECRVLLMEYCSLVAATHLLAAGRDRTGDYGRSATEIRHRNGLGQARTSDLLA